MRKSKKVLAAEEFVNNYIKHFGEKPSYSEIADGLGISKTAAYMRCKKLRNKMKEEKEFCDGAKIPGVTFKIYAPDIVEQCIHAVLQTQDPIKNAEGEEVLCLSVEELRTALKTIFRT